jgi:hypothetical protein
MIAGLSAVCATLAERIAEKLATAVFVSGTIPSSSLWAEISSSPRPPPSEAPLKSVRLSKSSYKSSVAEYINNQHEE